MRGEQREEVGIARHHDDAAFVRPGPGGHRRVHGDDDPVQPRGAVDPRALQQILVNLLQNATKFTSENGCITVRTRQARNAVNIYVEDNGIGIPQAALHKIGRPFEQVENEFSKCYKGSGLGLAIARSLVELHGGSLRIRSQEGVGTIVLVHLPTHSSTTSIALAEANY